MSRGGKEQSDNNSNNNSNNTYQANSGNTSFSIDSTKQQQQLPQHSSKNAMPDKRQQQQQQQQQQQPWSENSLPNNGDGHDSLSDDLSQDDYDDGDHSFYVPEIPFPQTHSTAPGSMAMNEIDGHLSEDIEQTTVFINHQLNISGFSASALQFQDATKEQAQATIQTIYKILQQHQKNLDYKQDLDHSWRRLNSDYNTTLENLNNTKAKLEKSERDVDQLSAKVGALEQELRTEGEKLRTTKEEVRTAKANLQYNKSQYAHEARKKEQEMNVLKEKVQKSVTDKYRSSNVALHILNPISRSGAVGLNKRPTGEDTLVADVLAQQKEKVQEVVAENEQLRQTLYTVQVEIDTLVKTHMITLNGGSTEQATNNGRQQNGNINNSNNVTSSLGLPYEMVKDRIETEIRDSLTVLEVQWTHRPATQPTIAPAEITLRDQRISDLEKQVELVQSELEESIAMAEGAQKMVDRLSTGRFLTGIQEFKLNIEGTEMTVPEIDEAELRLKKQQEELKAERKEFTQACLDLGKHREELEKNKREFEENKRGFHIDHFLSYLSTSSPEEVIDLSNIESDLQQSRESEQQQPSEQVHQHSMPPTSFAEGIPQHINGSSRKRVLTTEANEQFHDHRSSAKRLSTHRFPDLSGMLALNKLAPKPTAQAPKSTATSTADASAFAASLANVTFKAVTTTPRGPPPAKSVKFTSATGAATSSSSMPTTPRSNSNSLRTGIQGGKKRNTTIETDSEDDEYGIPNTPTRSGGNTGSSRALLDLAKNFDNTKTSSTFERDNGAGVGLAARPLHVLNKGKGVDGRPSQQQQEHQFEGQPSRQSGTPTAQSGSNVGQFTFRPPASFVIPPALSRAAASLSARKTLSTTTNTSSSVAGTFKAPSLQTGQIAASKTTANSFSYRQPQHPSTTPKAPYPGRKGIVG